MRFGTRPDQQLTPLSCGSGRTLEAIDIATWPATTTQIWIAASACGPSRRHAGIIAHAILRPTASECKALGRMLRQAVADEPLDTAMGRADPKEGPTANQMI